MSILLPVTILSGVVILVARYRRHEPSAFVLSLIAVSLMTAALVITLVVNVPLDNRFIEWTVATLPADWRASRDRWEFYHGLRTLLSVAALCSLVGSVLVGREPTASTLRPG